MSVEQIREEALKLPPEQRGILADELYASLPEEDDPEMAAMLNRRWDEIVTGKVKTIPMEQVLENARKRVEKVRANRQKSS